MILDPKLKDFATPVQASYVDAINEHGSMRAAARALGVQNTTVMRGIQSLKMRAAARGYSPEHDWTHVVPPTHIAKGVSTFYDKDGKVRGQWVKAQVDQDKLFTVVKAAIESMTESVRGLAPAVRAPKHSHEELLAVIPMGDPHWGMYAWGKETGEDFDTEIAKRLVRGAVDRLLQASPDCSACVILPLGDVLHADNQSNVTPGHGHQLDVDGRYVRVLQIAIDTYIYVVLQSLRKFPKVVVRFVKGNHDPNAVWAIALSISAFFAHEPRVEVDLTPAAHWYYRFGRVLIGATHGDKSKMEQLPGVMAFDRPEDWGQTGYRYWYTGHIHTKRVMESGGVVCESFRTLAARDAYAASHHYRAGRDMELIVHHATYGEIERHRCDIGMLEGSP